MGEPRSPREPSRAEGDGPHLPGVHPATGEPDPRWDLDADGRPVFRSPRVGPSSTGVRVVVSIALLVLYPLFDVGAAIVDLRSSKAARPPVGL